jgi:hypothetical protein
LKNRVLFFALCSSYSDSLDVGENEEENGVNEKVLRCWEYRNMKKKIQGLKK